MQTTLSLEQPAPAPAAAGAEPTGEGNSAGRALFAVFEAFERARVRYCVLHGYEDYPHRIRSDVDGVVDPGFTPGQLLALLHGERAAIGAEVVRCDGYHAVLAGKNAAGTPFFLPLDLGADCALDNLPFYTGAEVLESRRRYRGFWVPAANVAFGGYLARTIAKGSLDPERTQRLRALFREDPAGGAREAARFWSIRSTKALLSAVESGDWAAVRERLPALQAELRRAARLRSPGRFLRSKLLGFAGRVRRVLRPPGLNVVFLGTDGAGKSSVIEAMGPMLEGAFARSTCWGFAPPLLGRLRSRGPRRTDQPHALPPRGLLASLLRAAYWLGFHTLRYPKLRLALARATLVLNDRHFVDILVDAKRYRYGGPPWLLRLIWRLIPKPDLIVLLDARAEVLQARKQELPFEETAQQRQAYLRLVRTLPNGHVVDASQPFERVTADVSDIILRHLATRLARRFRFGEASS